MSLKPYNIQFTYDGRIINWQRYAESPDMAKSGAEKVLQAEYSGMAKIIKVKRLTAHQTQQLKRGAYKP